MNQQQVVEQLQLIINELTSLKIDHVKKSATSYSTSEFHVSEGVNIGTNFAIESLRNLLDNMQNKQPLEVAAVFDNEGLTDDSFTIVLKFDFPDENEHEIYTVSSNEIATIWSVSEESWDYKNVNETVKQKIGKRIEWYELPLPLRKAILSYFELADIERVKRYNLYCEQDKIFLLEYATIKEVEDFLKHDMESRAFYPSHDEIDNLSLWLQDKIKNGFNYNDILETCELKFYTLAEIEFAKQ